MLNDKIERFYGSTKSANFCMTHDRFFPPIFLDNFIGR